MSLRDDLLAEIDAFLKETGISPTAFGERATNDRALMISLRGGRDLRLGTVDKIRAFMVEERKRAKRLRHTREVQAA